MIVPLLFANGPSADAYGVELSANYSVSERWRLYVQYTLLELQMEESPVQLDHTLDPHNQIYFRSSWDLRKNLQFDLMTRYVDALNVLEVPSYITMDLRLAWRPREHLELAVVGQNLLQNAHREFAGNTAVFSTEVPHSIYGTVAWQH